MQYNRKKLLEYVEKAIAEHRVNWERKQREEAEEYQAARQAWIKDHGAKWEEAIARVQTALKEGHPVTKSMLPVSRTPYRDDAVVLFDGNLKQQKYAPPRELIAQRALLNAIEGDHVDSKQLKTKDVFAIAESYAQECID